MLLSLKDRLAIQGLYPQSSNFVNQLLVKDIAEKVALTQAEITKHKVIVDPETGFIRWNDKDLKDKDFKFTGAELNFLRSRVEALDQEQKITQDNLSLCQKIKDEKENDESNPTVVPKGTKAPRPRA